MAKTKAKNAAILDEAARSKNPIARCWPLGDRVVVRRDLSKSVSSGGVLLPESFAGQKEQTGVVISIGYDLRGQVIHFDVGDRVIITGWAGLAILDPVNAATGPEYVILRKEDILAVYEE